MQEREHIDTEARGVRKARPHAARRQVDEQRRQSPDGQPEQFHVQHRHGWSLADRCNAKALVRYKAMTRWLALVHPWIFMQVRLYHVGDQGSAEPEREAKRLQQNEEEPYEKMGRHGVLVSVVASLCGCHGPASAAHTMAPAVASVAPASLSPVSLPAFLLPLCGYACVC